MVCEPWQRCGINNIYHSLTQIKIGNRWNRKIKKNWKFQKNEKCWKFSKSGPRGVVKGKKMKNFIAFSWSESLNSHKKTIKKIYDFFWKIWPPKRPIFSFFFEKVILPKWSPYIALTSYQKSEKFLEPFWRKKSKTLFTSFLPLFGPKKDKGLFFSKIAFCHFSTFMVP